MSRRRVIADPLRFAREMRVMEGRVALADLARLVDVLAQATGELVWSVEGECGVDGKPFLRVRLQAEPVLSCQRCLQAMPLHFEHVSLLRLVRAGTPIGDEELEIDAYDTIEVEADLDVIALVEDEMLLALPVAPRHERCEPPGDAGGSRKESPFDVLAKLRGSGTLQ